MIEKVLSSVKKETDRQYFFSKLKNPLWVGPLRERGYFNNPPGVKQLPDGFVQNPRWPELSYLVTITADAPKQIVDIILGIKKTDNPSVYDDILTIALNLGSNDSARLLPKIIECTELENQFLAHRYSELLQYWTTQGNIGEALELVKALIHFQPDKIAREKHRRRKRNHNDSGISLEPAPRFNQWEYQQILEEGIRPLAENEPYQVAGILIDAVASMILLRMHTEDIKEVRDEDYSEIWCRRLDIPDSDYRDEKATLVNTLTFACEQVYGKTPESVDALDQALRTQRWKVFRRLRQHLYASHPNDQTLPWIRELILEHDDYSKWEHHYEFQLMVRKAVEHFGQRLLSEVERSAIFDAILSGPSKEDFREWMGDRYSEEAFLQRRRYFHRKQLRPFAALLSGEVHRYFDELEIEQQSDCLTDDSYFPYQRSQGGTVSYRSPKSAEELALLTDEDLLAYLNNWDEEHRDKNDWLVEITFSALAGVFQTFFKEKIIPDGKRLDFWMTNRGQIARPVYVTAMVKCMQELIKDKNFDSLDQWVEFCSWVLSHPDSERMEGQPEPRDESRNHPDWRSARQAVVEFIDACVNKDTEAPVSTRDSLANLLRHVCAQFDWRLDNERPILFNRDDLITEAINSTRGRALESLVHLGFWIRRHISDDPVPEVTEILSNRIAEDAEFPLTRPEHALLGMHFGNLCALNREWAIDQREILFPHANIPTWREAFSSYIRFNRPATEMFKILREDFLFALDNLDLFTAAKDDDRQIIDRLGQHLFAYYMWQIYPLKADNSLLVRFYDKTTDDRQYWARLFDHVGRSLSNSGKHLNKELTDRAIAYFDWRFETAEPLELQEFTFWLEAECLDPEWRLRSYSRILDLGHGKNELLSLNFNTLNKLLPGHLPLVVECFAKITDTLDQNTQMYISTSEPRPILQAGLKAEDPMVRENAERARENLLRLGRFDFLDEE